jgi:hypothetical protein
MLWPKWVVLIAGSTGSALRAVALSNRHITPDARTRSRRECDGFFVALALSHHRPGHPSDLVGERNGSDLGRSPRQQCRKPGSMLGAVKLSLADISRR